ncbi:MAG: DNA polymerase III subunit beta [Coriobacteriia bacterium]|nr:DNA polymerase III subunit beta [Coriobacteriia bacterium]
MRLSIARGELLDSLNVVTKALSSRTTLPILSGILISAVGDSVILQSTDLEISIKHTIGAGVEESGSVVMPGRLLAEVVRSLPEAAVHLETSSFDQVKVTCGTSSFVLRSLSPDDFPKFPEVSPGRKMVIPTATLTSLVRRVSRAVSRDEARPILTGILMVIEGTVLRVVATDSYRLAIAEAELPEPVEERIEVVVPGKALEEIPKLAGGAETVSMGIADNQIIFEFGSSVYVTRRIEGAFPNYRQLVPQDGETKVTVSRADLEGAAKRVSLLAQHNAPLRVKVSDSTLTLSAQTQDVGEASEDLMVATEGEPIEIAFNHAFLVDGLASSDEENLAFVASSPLKPGVFRSTTGEGFTYLIMPVRP